MSKLFEELDKKAEKIPKMNKWDLYNFLFNLKSSYKVEKNYYLFEIERDFWPEEYKEITNKLYWPEEYKILDKYDDYITIKNKKYNNSYDTIYREYINYFEKSIRKWLNGIVGKIIKEDNIIIKEREKLILSLKNVDKPEVYYHWKMQYILYINEDIMNSISDKLLLDYDRPKMDSIENFYDLIEEQFKKAKRPDNIIYIDKIKNYSYNKIKNGLFTLFYTDRIKSFKLYDKWFDVELLGINNKVISYISWNLLIEVKDNWISFIDILKNNRWYIDLKQSMFWNMLKFCLENDIKWPIEITKLYGFINENKSKIDSEKDFVSAKSGFINSKNNKINKALIDNFINKEKGNRYSVVLNFKVKK